MKAQKKIIVSFLVIAFVFFAATESKALQNLFEDMDLNKDGRVDRSEFSEDMKKKAFEKLDVDKNREITEAEWISPETILDQDKHSELFKRIDKDKNRRITFFEFSDYAEEDSNIEDAFIGLDKDMNNSLTPEEITIRPVFRMITIYF